MVAFAAWGFKKAAAACSFSDVVIKEVKDSRRALISRFIEITKVPQIGAGGNETFSKPHTVHLAWQSAK
jgi:hypothetical protein